MPFTNDDLASAAAKLATIEFTSAETEAVASFLNAESAEVSGFGYEPPMPKGFLLEVSGFMPGTKEGFTATDDLARVKGFTATDDLAR